jgi:hypothetical protein
VIVLVVVGLHFLLASGFMLAFFHAPSTAPVEKMEPVIN